MSRIPNAWPARHILIPIHDFNAGGTEGIAFRLAAAWIAAGRAVTILAGASDGPMRALAPAGAAVHILSPECPRSPLSRLFLGKPMAAAAKALCPDVIFVPGNFHFILAAAFKRALPHVPVVAKISNPLVSGSQMTAPQRIGLNWFTRGIDHFVAMAPALTGIAAAQLADRPLAAIADPFMADDSLISPREGSPGDADSLRLLAIGRLEPQKDMLLGVEALARLHKRRPARLTILGDGSQRAKLEARIVALGLGDHVTLAGHVADVRPWLARHDMLVMPSRFEGVPAVIGEALCNGLPFAATACTRWLADLAAGGALGCLAARRSAGALADAIDAVAGRRFPPQDAIADAIDAHRMRNAAPRYLALFDGLAATAG